MASVGPRPPQPDPQEPACERCGGPPNWQCLNCGLLFCGACYREEEKEKLMCRDCIAAEPEE